METIVDTMTFGALTGEAVGIILKEAVRRAIKIIRAERFAFEVTEKFGGYKDGRDFVTSADFKAEKMFARLFRECFPGFGVVSEEGLSVPCTMTGRLCYFTLDPLDGSNAMVRRQSHGIGVMLALVADGRIVAAFVGDVMTEEIYGYRPGSRRVHRISHFDHAEELKIDEERPLVDQVIVLTDNKPGNYPSMARLLAGITGAASPFRGVEISGGSIGVLMARLWKSEVGAVLMGSHAQPPWDFTPILGISRHMGFVFMTVDPATGTFALVDPRPAVEPQPMGSLLVIHGSRASDLLAWQAGQPQ